LSKLSATKQNVSFVQIFKFYVPENENSNSVVEL